MLEILVVDKFFSFTCLRQANFLSLHLFILAMETPSSYFLIRAKERSSVDAFLVKEEMMWGEQLPFGVCG